LTATHGSTVVTFTLTEQNKPVGATTSYLWDFGDGSTKPTTSTPTTTYTYPNAGSFTAKCTPTINSQQEPIATASAPVVVS
jgi:PKD repeat protein